MPMAGLPTTAAAMRWGRRAAACSAIAPPTAMPASATLPVMPSASISAARSSTMVSMESAPRTFSDSPAPRVS